VVDSNKGVDGQAVDVHLKIRVNVVENTISKRSEVAGDEEELDKITVADALEPDVPAAISWMRA
jgi:hypothetical protein